MKTIVTQSFFLEGDEITENSPLGIYCYRCEKIIKEKISDVFYAKYLANVIAKANPIRVKK